MNCSLIYYNCLILVQYLHSTGYMKQGKKIITEKKTHLVNRDAVNYL